jgi:aminoglycoside phosphotransferase (APT) family kinase protein
MSVGGPGALIGAGRNADVYDVGGGRVLRRYRDGREARRVETEAQVMVRARAAGVPVPEVFDVSESDIVMERALGPTMLAAFGRRPWTFRAQAGLLARLHGRVHQVPASALDGLDVPAPFGTLEPGEGDVLLHRDLHPANVILTSGGPMIIDWEGAARGPAVADVAMTWVIVRFSDVPGPRLEAFAARGVQAAFTRSFVRAAGPVDDSWRLAIVQRRLGDPNLLPAEVARLEKLAAAPRPPGTSALGELCGFG